MNQTADPIQIIETLITLAIPLTAIVFGLIEFLKAAFQLEGRSVTVVSFFVGLVFGVNIFVAWLYPAAAVYIYGAIFICSSGLVASGYYKFINNRLPDQSKSVEIR
ncbi:MAG: hypothetical protein ACOYYS_19320 [Chloroflexota bacterium]